MRYNYDIIDDCVADAIRLHYDEYLIMLENKPSKLAFVKRLNEHTGLGLKDSKFNADIIFSGSVILFKNEFSLKLHRRRKLDALKKNLLSRELVDMIKKYDSDKLYDIFTKLDIEILEQILGELLYD